MAGEASRNPGSSQYRGPLPDVALHARLALQVLPNAAFIERVKELRAAGVDGPVTMTDADKDAVMFAVGQWVIPSRVTDQWPQSELPFMELGRMPLTQFKKQHRENFERNGMAAQAATIEIQEEAKIEV